MLVGNPSYREVKFQTETLPRLVVGNRVLLVDVPNYLDNPVMLPANQDAP